MHWAHVSTAQQRPHSHYAAGGSRGMRSADPAYCYGLAPRWSDWCYWSAAVGSQVAG